MDKDTVIEPKKTTTFIIGLIRSHLKNRLVAPGVSEAGFGTAGILQYVEDLKSGINAQIWPEDFFEMASIKNCTQKPRRSLPRFE